MRALAIPATRRRRGERVDALDRGPVQHLRGGVRPAGRAHDAAVGAPPDPRRRLGRTLLRHLGRGVSRGQGRSHMGDQPERGQVADRLAPGDAVLPVPLRRQLPHTESRGPVSRPRRHRRDRGFHLRTARPAGTGVSAAAELPRLPRVLRGGLRIPVRLRGHQLVHGWAGGAADRRHPDAPARHRGRGSRGSGGGGRSRSPRPDGRSRHPGPDRGDGGLVPHGTGPSLVPTGLLEPQGGRGLPPGHRRTGLCG